MKVGFICLHDENSTYDKNFIDSAKRLQDAGLSEDQYIIKTNIPENQDCYNAAAELVDAGCTAIFADSFGHEDFMIQAAKEFKDVQFYHATGTKAHTENLSNFHNAFASIYEAVTSAGVAAGMKLNEMIDAGEIKADEARWLCRCLHLRGSHFRLHLLLPRRQVRVPVRDHGSHLHRLLVR